MKEQQPLTEYRLNIIEKTLERLEQKFDAFSENLDEKYASKSSVNRLWAIVWTVIGTVFAYLGSKILHLF
ncbi:MAG: hypothetical protein LBD11_08375 [Candidatus Peribacteria bacterium]|jgi:hypothetical protein|nr:hypothetical protein [Candidatus Peribacteria bacterium]